MFYFWLKGITKKAENLRLEKIDWRIGEWIEGFGDKFGF
jgi:hypothetical protein